MSHSGNKSWQKRLEQAERQYKKARRKKVGVRIFKFVMVCSRCNKQETVTRNEQKLAARVRCSSCGGPLNKPGQA